MPKYWSTNYFAHGSFPEVGQKQKTEKKKKERKREREREKERLNNRQATHGARKPPGPILLLIWCKEITYEKDELSFDSTAPLP